MRRSVTDETRGESWRRPRRAACVAAGRREPLVSLLWEVHSDHSPHSRPVVDRAGAGGEI